MAPTQEQNSGEAYAIFKGANHFEEIESNLQYAKNLSNAPKQLSLELYKIEDLDETKLDTNLQEYVKLAKSEGMDSVIVSNLPYATNKKTAEETAPVMNQIYLGTFNKGEEFRGNIIYKLPNGTYNSLS